MMTIAIVKDGLFKHTTNEPIIKLDEFNILDTRKMTREERVALGWFDFVPARDESLPGQKAQGTTFSVDAEAGTVTESFLYVDMTAEEIKDATNNPLDQQIDGLERREMLPRWVRDELRTARIARAVAAGLTEDNLLDKDHVGFDPGYKKFKKIHDDIATLRGQRV